ncbi:ubiquitin-protein transferase [Aureococcus anophagefferens]|uniref:Ubiquitin-protein transferase n=1 Tax=Aureococcus anophagefferens TaxID=44056 RepID=A0ABR1G3J3_AURAN
MAALAGFAPPKKLAGFADAKKQLKGFADAAPAKSAAAPLTSAAAAAPTPAAAPLKGFAAAKPAPLQGFAAARPAPRSAAPSRSIPPGRVGRPRASGVPLTKSIGAGAARADHARGADGRRVDLELDRPAAPADDGDLTNVEAAVYNMKVVCAYEDVALDAGRCSSAT